MTATLILSNNSASNPLTLDLSRYLDLTDGTSMDPLDPAFSQKVISHSLLKEGGVLALEDLAAKELVFPVKLNATTGSALALLIQQINQIVTSAGATYSWQDTGMSQPTIFDAISGQLDIKYRYREAERFWCNADLKLFAQPFGHTATRRRYATASGVGPLLMITPYASGTGQQVIGASTQAGVSGYGGVSQGGVPSGGVFYWGSPSLAGDAPAQLQISYVGPYQPGASGMTGAAPFVAAAVLPDASYRPLITAPELSLIGPGFTALASEADVPQGVYVQMAAQPGTFKIAGVGFYPLPSTAPDKSPTSLYAGQHRVFAIARYASSGVGSANSLSLQPNALVSAPAGATVSASDWGLYDLGTIRLTASQTSGPVVVGLGAVGRVDVAALAMLPESSTFYLNPLGISPSSYGYPAQFFTAANSGGGLRASAPWSNTLLLDDVLGDQFMYGTPGLSFAPSPAAMTSQSGRITQFTRGLIPRPDPKNGMPIIALLGVGQIQASSYSAQFSGAGTWTNLQNSTTYAQVNVLERTRYTLG